MEVDEEEAWLNEKMAFVSSDEAGDTLAAVQELMKKHEAFETDLATHRERVRKIEREAERLVGQGNYQSESINQRMKGVQVRIISPACRLIHVYPALPSPRTSLRRRYLTYGQPREDAKPD